jgi:TolB-like protein/Flp pilus assembly protein TadD
VTANAQGRNGEIVRYLVNPKKFFSELQRRKVYRVAIAYIVAAWVLIQVATQVFPFYEIPNWAIRLVISTLVLGFPVALFLSWAFDITPAGIVRTDDVANPAPPSVIPEKSIAVLPFENLSDDQQNTYFADGIQDDILSSLAKVADLKVISRTSVRQYRGGARNLRDIGAALGVAHILEGTVRRAGNRVRVNAQLIDARTDAHLWADTFDREITDLFLLQTELAEKIAAELRANLSPQEKASMQMHPTADLAAYDLYLQARDLFRWSGAGDPRENGEKAVALLDEALRRDPQFAVAHALASRFHAELFWFGHDRTSERLEKAKTEAETALRIRPELGDARLALAYYHYYGARNYVLAREQLALALRATPNDAEVWDAAGAVDRRQGLWQDALRNFERARQLDPRNAAVLWNLAETYACVGEYDGARRVFSEGFEVNPNAYLFLLARAALALKERGDLAPLAEALRSTPKGFDPGGSVTAVAVRLSLMRRDYAEAGRLLDAIPYRQLHDAGIGGSAGSLDGFAFPKEWYVGLVLRGQNDIAGAADSFAKARQSVESDAEECGCGKDAKTYSFLGMVDAALGRNEQATEEGRKAILLLPRSLDAFDGPVLATNLAAIYAAVGDSDRAFEQLASLRNVPNGPTQSTLRIEPEWDSLRQDPRFQQLTA